MSARSFDLTFPIACRDIRPGEVISTNFGVAR
jgi:hypothetical protein